MPDLLFIPDLSGILGKIVIYVLFLAALGLGCCWGAAGCGEQGLSSLQSVDFLLQWLLLFVEQGSR